MLDQPISVSTSQQEAPQERRGLTSWVGDNMVKPLVNSLLIEPEHAVANVVNGGAHLLGQDDVLGKVKLLETPQAKFMSAQWFAQSMSGCVGMILPYAVAGKMSGGAMRAFGEQVGAEGAMASVLKNERLAQITGAGGYAFLLDPQPGQTRLGNAIGTAAGFGVFELGGALSTGLSFGGKTFVRAVTGMVGGSTQESVTSLVSTGQGPDREHLVQSALSGAVINVAMPTAQEGLQKAIDAGNTITGRGIPVERYVQSKLGLVLDTGLSSQAAALTPEGLGKASNLVDNLQTGHSPTLSGLVNDAPWLRVQEVAGQSAYLAGKDRVELGAQDRTPEGLSHELGHRDQAKSGAYAADFEAAQKHLLNGDIEAARAQFTQTRLAQELAAIKTEQRVSAELGKTPEQIDANNIASTRLHDGRTYAQAWSEEFQRFAESRGQVLPDVDYKAKTKLADPEHWRDLLANWDGLSQKDKLNSLRDLNRAPEKSRLEVFLRAMLNPGEDRTEESKIYRESRVWSVREAADKQFDTLPPGDRMKAFRQMLSSDDYFIRLLAISHIGDMPARERPRAFADVVHHPKALISPEPPGGRNYWSKDEYKPHFPGWHSNPLKEPLSKSAGELLVESISSLPPGERSKAWDTAFRMERKVFDSKNRHHTEVPAREAAAGNLSVLPDATRPQKWFQAWQEAGRSSNSKIHSALIAQIPELPSSYRSEAWDNMFASRLNLSGDAVNKALMSLPEEERLPAWQKLFERSTPEWSRQFTRYETADASAYGASRNADLSFDTATVDRGLGRSIEALPEWARLDAFNKVAALDARRYANELVQVIPSLPESGQMGAVRFVMELAEQDARSKGEPRSNDMYSRFRSREPQAQIDVYKLEETMSALPMRQWPDIVDAIKETTSGELRVKLLGGFQFYTLVDKLTVPEKLDNVTRMFQRAEENIQPQDYQALARWWGNVGNLEPSPDPMVEIAPTPVRDALIETLDPRLMARLTTSHSDSTSMDALATESPQTIKSIMQKFWDSGLPGDGHEEETRMVQIVDQWQADRNLKTAALNASLPIEKAPNKWGSVDDASYDLLPPLIQGLSEMSTVRSRAEALAALKEQVLQYEPPQVEETAEGGSNENTALRLPIRMAAAVGAVDPATFQKEFLQPLNEALSDRASDFSWRLRTAREIASLQREGELPQSSEFIMPDLRMPKVLLPEAQMEQLRKEFIAGLYSEAALRKLMGAGTLGQMFPSVFGDFGTAGGIVGRPQHAGHEFNVDDHTMLVMQRIRNNPGFAELSAKDQENVLIAALHHDAAKRPNMHDPDHEWAGSNLVWGVMGSLGFSPVRIQRVANLIARHSQLSYYPDDVASERLNDPKALDDIATFYRHPSAVRQLRIFNESDIRSIDDHSSLWTQPVEAELNQVSRRTESQVRRLNQNLVPLLTSEIPANFSLVLMDRPYALLAHVSPHLNDSFLKQLSLIESPEYSISSSLITPQHQQFYYGGEPTFAIVQGPWEQISQSYRDNLGTGTSVDWNGHVELSKQWLESDRAKSFAREVEALARQSRVPKASGNAGSLETARRAFGQYDSFDELVRDKGSTHPLVEMQQSIHQALTTDAAGGALNHHNEVKLNSPTVSGLGVLRQGKPVFIENADAASIERLLGGNSHPDWLYTGADAPKNAIIIKEQTWKTLLERDLPIVVLDP